MTEENPDSAVVAEACFSSSLAQHPVRRHEAVADSSRTPEVEEVYSMLPQIDWSEYVVGVIRGLTVVAISALIGLIIKSPKFRLFLRQLPGTAIRWLAKQWQRLVIVALLILIEVLLYLYLAYADWRIIALSTGHFALIAVAAWLLARHDIVLAMASPALVYDFIDRLGDATLRNEGTEKIRPAERALSKRRGGTEMRAIYAHPGHPRENTEVTYQLPAEFAVARHLVLSFAVAILGEHPVEGRGSGFKTIPENHARFEVCVNGKIIFKRVFNTEDPHLFEWEHHVMRIAEVKGRSLKVDLITNAMGNLSYIWTAWGEPKLIAIFGA